MKRIMLFVVALFAFTHALAASEAPYPADWKSWTSMNTALTGIGALPDCTADVAKMPPIYQKIVETYCAVKAGGPGKVAVLAKPASVKNYEARDGKFAEGPNMILHLKDMKVLFVTAHKGGKPSYGVYTEDGKDIAAASGPLATSTCVSCHTGYQAFCHAGQCGSAKK